MSPPGRPKGEYRSAQHEGTPVNQPTRGRRGIAVAPHARPKFGRASLDGTRQ